MADPLTDEVPVDELNTGSSAPIFSQPPPSIAQDPLVLSQSAGPGDLGLGLPPQRTIVPVQPPLHLSAKQRIVQLAALAAGLGLGPGAGTGVAAGAVLGQRHLEDLHQEAIRNQEVQQRTEDYLYEQQQRQYQQESDRRRALLSVGLTNLQHDLLTAPNKPAADQLIRLYGTRFTALGIHGYDENALRKKGYQYVATDARQRAAEAVTLAIKNSPDLMKRPDQWANAMIPVDLDGTGMRSYKPLDQMAELSGMFAIDRATGKVIVVPKGMDASKAVTAAAELERLTTIAKYEGKNVDENTPEGAKNVSVLAQQATRTMKEATVDPVTKALQDANILSTIEARKASAGIAALGAQTNQQLAQMRLDADRREQARKDEKNALARDLVTSNAREVISTIDTLIDPKTGQLTPVAASLYGLGTGRLGSYMPNSAAADTDAVIKKLTSEQVIGLLNEMKHASQTGATGFGALQKNELDLVQSAATTITNRNISASAAAREIKRIREKAQAVIDRAQSGTTAPGTTPPAPSGGKSGTLGRLQYQVLGE